MTGPLREPAALSPGARAFLDATPWKDARCDALAGDASVRRYFRLRGAGPPAVFMDASQAATSVPPFVRIARHLRRLDLSAPEIFEASEAGGFLLLEDFGDDTFSGLLESGAPPDTLYPLAVEVLEAIHRHPEAIPPGLRAYDPARMLSEIELFLDWRAPGIDEAGKTEFRAAWSEALPWAHQVPATLMLRDYHAANLMRLPGRPGLLGTGLLDFQDAFQGPVTYDLVSLLQDARRDVPPALQARLIAQYQAGFPQTDPGVFDLSLAVVAAVRHTRVLAIFEKLSRLEGKHDYKKLHSPRVERLLRAALRHPRLARLQSWFDRHAR